MLRRGFMAATLTAAPRSGAETSPVTPRLIYDVREFGAEGGRKRNEAAQIQAAIDACHSAGGGTVYVPAGEYLSGTLWLKSHVTLYLDAGATIHASGKADDYTPGTAQLITASKAEYISILGPGVLNGGGIADLGRRPGTAYEPRPGFRPQVILLEDCRQVILRDFTILYSDSWACHLRFCEKVVMDGVTIFSNYFRTNSDGIDPVSCRDVRISNCHITAGDDCICLKTDKGMPCEDIVITNCTTESSATAIKLGTGSFGDYRNITISNCTVRNSTVGVGFFIKDGGAIDGVTVSNLTIETLRDPMQLNPEKLRNMIYPIFLDIEKRDDNSAIGAMRNILFNNIFIRSDNGILIQGMRESVIENLTLSNICFQVSAAFDYSQKKKHAGGTVNPKDDRITIYARHPTYCAIANVRNLLVDNLSVQADAGAQERFPRSALALLNVERAIVRAVRGCRSAVEQRNSAGVSIS
jgi:hypothetical protein